MAQLAAAAAASRPTLRGLCLHGFRTNDDIMRFQTLQLQRNFEQGELVLRHINGPRSSPSPADAGLLRLSKGPFYEWWNAVETGGDAGEGLFGFSSNPESVHYEGLADTIRHVRHVVREEGPFDLLVGFSQGGILATLLTALMEKPAFMTVPPISHEGEQSTEPATQASWDAPFGQGWKCVVLVGAMQPRDTHFPPGFLDADEDDAAQRGLATPSVHVYGLADPMATKSKELAAWWAGGAMSATGTLEPLLGAAGSVTVVEHSGGHRFPGGRGSTAQYDAIRDAVRCACHTPAESVVNTAQKEAVVPSL